ncbi:MAG: hypothetical protein ACI9OU_002659 [Candidatus Promineifilaceae bacterium]|jgi:hypothetical protein
MKGRMMCCLDKMARAGMVVLFFVHLSPAFADVLVPTEGTAGFVELSGRANPDIVGGELGLIGWFNGSLSAKGSFSFLASEPLEDFFAGANISIQTQFPWRFSPYVGVGAFAGYSREDVRAENDNLDNDDDGFTDERGEEKSVVDNVTSSVYPEIGLLMWVKHDVRLSISGRYHISSEGRDFDAWIYAVGFAARM